MPGLVDLALYMSEMDNVLYTYLVEYESGNCLMFVVFKFCVSFVHGSPDFQHVFIGWKPKMVQRMNQCLFPWILVGTWCLPNIVIISEYFTVLESKPDEHPCSEYELQLVKDGVLSHDDMFALAYKRAFYCFRYMGVRSPVEDILAFIREGYKLESIRLFNTAYKVALEIEDVREFAQKFLELYTCRKFMTQRMFMIHKNSLRLKLEKLQTTLRLGGRRPGS